MRTIGRNALRIGAVAAVAGLTLGLAACSQSSDTDEKAESLSILIGSSGDAETQAVEDAMAAWSKKSGIDVEVVVASDLNQQLGQGFSGGNPPDLFYMSWDQFQTYASNGYLEPYGDDLSNKDEFYPALTDAFSYDDQFYCAPKDFSTLGLVINTDLWAAAGLTDADIPTDWDGLEAAATKLTSGTTTGLSFGAEYARVGTFMNQAGGAILSEDGETVDAASAENVDGLNFVKKLLDAGVVKYPSALDSGWAGEAFGKQAAAMVIEGPWIQGALKNDYPDVNYKVAELPEGPGGKSTFTFSNCWGIPAGSSTKDDAVDLVEFLTSDEQQLAFADAFGVIPSTESGAKAFAEKYPENAPFVSSNDFAISPVAFAGAASVLTDFNSQIEGLGDGDPATILDTFQTNLQAALDEANG